MKAIHVLLVLLLLLAGISVTVLTSEPMTGATGLPHPTIAGVMIGGDGAARIESLHGLPYYFQHISIMICGLLMYLGIAEKNRDTGLRLIISCMTLVSMTAWYMTFASYEAYWENGETPIILGFPLPTLWFLGGLWASYLPPMMFYVFAFRRYFYPIEDEKAFEQLVADMKVGGGQE